MGARFVRLPGPFQAFPSRPTLLTRCDVLRPGCWQVTPRLLEVFEAVRTAAIAHAAAPACCDRRMAACVTAGRPVVAAPPPCRHPLGHTQPAELRRAHLSEIGHEPFVRAGSPQPAGTSLPVRRTACCNSILATDYPPPSGRYLPKSFPTAPQPQPQPPRRLADRHT